MFLRHHSFKILVPAALMLAAGTSFAGAQTRSIGIDTSDLDLASNAGRAVLQQRIGHAVDNICGSPHTRSTAEQVKYASCSAAARTDVQTKVDAMVAAAENARKMAGMRGATPGM
jgi:UrcA family protein